MKTREIIYWLKFALGVTAAFICTGFGMATGSIGTTFNEGFPYPTLMNGLSIALVIYLISYYVIKSKFSLELEKPQKILTIGIGIYFVSWIVFWVLLYTIAAATMT